MVLTRLPPLLAWLCAFGTSGLLGFGASAWAQADTVKISAAPAALTLQQAMDLAEGKSHTLKAARAAEGAAAARISQSDGAIGPRLGLEVNEVWFDKSTNDLVGHTLPNGTPVPDRVNTAGIVLAQPLTGVFALRDKRGGDQHLAEAAAADSTAARRQARVRVAAAYIQVLKAAKFREIALESQKVIERQKSDAGKLKAEGKLAQLDYSRLEFAQSEVVTQVNDAEANLAAASVALRELLGLGDGVPLEIQDLPDVAGGAVKATPQTQNPAGADRPEAVAAEARVRATQDYREAARVDYWPVLNAFARYDRDFTAKTIEAPTVRYEREDIRDKLSYGFAVNWTIWDWNVRHGRQRELAAETSRTEALRDETVANIRVEQAQVRAELARATQNQRNAAVSRDLSERIFKATETKFRNGLATTTDLLLAERDLTRARGGLANAAYDRSWAEIQYRKALGENP